ncbi:MAG: hypothetical protein GX174_01835 [Lentisphaerae bacterium]|jgi:endonuclease V-like protein UPF0215 family|nr:hypothetical protein [Lentisphaerota bacterium]
MGTGRTLHKKPRTRPVKSTGERRRREKTQLKRLVALGVDADEAAKMSAGAVRTALKRPEKVKAAVAKAAETA